MRTRNGEAAQARGDCSPGVRKRNLAGIDRGDFPEDQPGFVGVQFALVGAAWLPSPSEPLSAGMVRWVRYWDFHRQPFPLVTGAMALVGLTAVMSVAGLTWLRDRFDGASPFLFRALLVAFAIGGVVSISYWFDQAPLALIALMPSRAAEISNPADLRRRARAVS